MRIGIDARDLLKPHPTGIGTYIDHIVSYLAENGNYEIYLYTPADFDLAAAGRSYPDTVKVRVVPTRLPGTLWLRYALPKVLRCDKIDIFWGASHLLPAKCKGIRYVLTVHDLALFIEPRWGKRNNVIVLKTFMPRSVNEADAILVDSLSTQNDLVRICHADESKISCVYLGGVKIEPGLICPDALKRVKEKFSIRDRYFYYVGTIEPRKNIETIVKAFEHLSNDYPDVDLVLAGVLGWRYEGILEQIECSPVKDRIRLTGYLTKEEKVNLYAGSQAFLFPSHYEGFGLPILEAMVAGTIVITDQVSSLPEVAGDAALYIEDENNVNALASQMRRSLEMDKAERSVILEAGKKQAGKFSWENCARETVKVLLGELR